MCIKRHSAPEPRRLPIVRINFAQPQSFRPDCGKRSFATSFATDEARGETNARAWGWQEPANENYLLRRRALWQRMAGLLRR
jgi:hypothetical protein